MRVLITGATGFVGSRLAAISLSRGIGVRAVVRSSAGDLGPGVERVELKDIRDVARTPWVMAGVDAVVHLAARVHVMRERAKDPLAAFREVNVGGTEAVLNAAIAGGVGKFVMISTVKVHGEGGTPALRAADPLSPSDPYSVSKAEAEALVVSHASRIHCAVVRPPLVHGPGVGGNMRSLLRLVIGTQNVPLPLGGIRNQRSLAYVDNVADAILHVIALGDAEESGKAWLVSDGEDVSTSELVCIVRRAAGLNARLLPCPQRLLRAGGNVLGRSTTVNRLLDCLAVDISALRGTGWNPPVAMKEGLRRTVAWWLQSKTRRK